MADAIRQIGVSEVTYYSWRKEFGGLKIEQLKRARSSRLLPVPSCLPTKPLRTMSDRRSTGFLRLTSYANSFGIVTGQRRLDYTRALPAILAVALGQVHLMYCGVATIFRSTHLRRKIPLPLDPSRTWCGGAEPT
jgi:hypothetical protein